MFREDDEKLKIPFKSKDDDSVKEETKKLEGKSVEAFASKTYYGVNPLEMAKQFEKENPSKIDEEDETDEKTTDKADLGNMKPEEESAITKEVKLPISQSQNPGNVFKKSATTGLFGQKNPMMAGASFGQSSLSQAMGDSQKETFGIVPPKRTFGSASHDAHPSSSGFTGLVGSNQPKQSTFLESGANAQEDNDMAEDEDIFGGNQPQQNPNFMNPAPFGVAKSTINFDPKSNPSFTQRRK
jgi:hypothetical protein